MGKHSAAVVPFRFGVFRQKPKEIPEYCSRDIQFDWPEGYEPPFPLTEKEKRLMELNRTEKEASVAWVINETRDIVNEELNGQRPST